MTKVDLDDVAADVFHREHASVELAIRDLKAGRASSSAHRTLLMSAAWLGCAILARGDAGCSTCGRMRSLQLVT